MIVVADTSPLNYLIQLELESVLADLFGEVLIPEAVLRELKHSGAPAPVSEWARRPSPWLKICHVDRVDPSLKAALGDGEREAISLAMELKADLLVIDEAAGRIEAEARRVRVIGTLAVLFRAAVAGQLDFPALATQLKQLGFRVSRSLELTMRQEFELQRTRSLQREMLEGSSE
jgi:predicted nucleic acid-binding protein